MHVRYIDSNRRREVRQFIRFPFELYRACASWVPPLIPDLTLVMNRKKHPFYHHSKAAFYVAEEAGRILGRLAVLENSRYNEYRKQKTAFFYYFDAVEDASVSGALFDKAVRWARQRGLDRMIGPIGFLQGDGIGLLVEGFEHRPALGIAYNYPYYDTLLHKAGFNKKTDYFSGYLPGDYDLPQRFYAIAETVKKKRGFWIKSFHNKRELRAWVPRIQDVYNKAFVDNFEHYPISDEEAKAVADRLLAIANPRFIKLVMKGNEIIGFLFAFVDVSAALQRNKGRLWPLGWIGLLREFTRAKWVNFNGTGLLPGHRGVGANAVLYTEMARTVHQFGFEHADIVQIEERNVKSMGDMNAIGVQWYKKHRVYEQTL